MSTIRGKMKEFFKHFSEQGIPVKNLGYSISVKKIVFVFFPRDIRPPP
jgi:hypothetical protein